MADNNKRNKRNKTNFKLIGISLVLVLLIGCASPDKLKYYDGIYQVKQIPIGGFGSSYIICKNCIEFTRFVSVMQQEKPK